MIKDCSTCDYCQWNKLNNGYVCENEDSPLYGVEIGDWLDNICDGWTYVRNCAESTIKEKLRWMNFSVNVNVDTESEEK